MVTDRNLEELRTEAADAISRSQEYAIARAAKRNRKPKLYSEGDFVIILNVDIVIGTNKKFIPKFRGPYRVHRVLGHDRYVIRDIENCQLTQLPYDGVVEANRMLEWLAPSKKDKSNCSTEESDTEDESEYEFEANKVNSNNSPCNYILQESNVPEIRSDAIEGDEDCRVDGFEGFGPEDHVSPSVINCQVKDVVDSTIVEGSPLGNETDDSEGFRGFDQNYFAGLVDVNKSISDATSDSRRL